MAVHRNRKNKENPHYGFLVSWKPNEAHVKREPALEKKLGSDKADKVKKADYMAQQTGSRSIKKNLIKSLILVSFILILEVVIYLAWNYLILS